MANVIIVVGSVTAASRLAKKISHIDINSAVIHTPAAVSRQGCSYSVRTRLELLGEVKGIIKHSGIKVRQLLLERESGGVRVYDAIS